MDESSGFRGARALITGGLGFIGSNLALALVHQGAEVTVADALIPGQGGNPFNLLPVREKITVHYGDVRDANAVQQWVRDQDFVFHLAAQVDHVRSILESPFDDIDINVKGTTVLLEACRHHNPQARIVYAGTRGQYGRTRTLPVGEETAMRPLGVYDVTKLAAEKMLEVYQHISDLRCVSLRISNVYGPRSQMRHSRFNVVNWFIRLAMENATIPVFGDGRILRDFLYVDDCVEALLACALQESAWGKVFNVGVDQPMSFIQLADAICRSAGSGRWELTPFSPERIVQEPGDYYPDISRIRDTVGWAPRTSLETGLAKTVAFYRDHARHYWPAKHSSKERQHQPMTRCA